MGLQLSGGPNINTTFTTTVGTRQEIVTGLETALTAAGWTVISGGGTGNVLMQSGLTPQGLQCRVRLYDSGAGTCARVFLLSVDGLRVQTTPCYLLPTALKTFRVIANPYQFFVFVPGSSAAREFCAAGVPWVPSYAGVTEAIWSQCNAEADTSVSNRPSFRLYLDVAAGNGIGNCGTGFSCVNGNCWSFADTANQGGNIGGQKLLVPQSASQYSGGGWNNAYRWFNNAVTMYEPLIAWGATTWTDEAKLIGQLWDAYICSVEFVADVVKVVNARNFFAITNNNAGFAGSHARGTLMVLVP